MSGFHSHLTMFNNFFNFMKSSEFLASSKYKKFIASSIFSQTNYFSSSKNFKKTKAFISSKLHIKSRDFTDSQEFIESKINTISKYFTNTKKINSSTHFTYNGSTLIKVSIDEDQNISHEISLLNRQSSIVIDESFKIMLVHPSIEFMQKSSLLNIGIIIGLILAILIILIFITLMIKYFSRKTKESSEDGNYFDMADPMEMSTGMNYLSTEQNILFDEGGEIDPFEFDFQEGIINNVGLNF